MATIVCPMTLRLKLSTPKSLELSFKSRFDQPQPKTQNKPQEDARPVPGGGWSFLQALSPTSNGLKKDKEEVYVHPLVKRIQASLSDKSLAMCTESLGSENGSDDMVADFDALLSMSTSSSEKRRAKSTKQRGTPRNFPPPLTTISGSECLRISARREEGKMVMEAVKTQACIRSERSHGRIRLYYSTPRERVDSENDITEKNQEKLKQREETEHGVENQEVGGGGLDMNVNKLKLGGKMGIEESHSNHRPRRCIEGEIENRKSLNWEPFWVATS